MEKRFVLFNVDNQKYWTGRIWDNPFTREIENAEQFVNEEDVEKLLTTTEDENLWQHDIISKVEMFEMKTVFVKL